MLFPIKILSWGILQPPAWGFGGLLGEAMAEIPREAAKAYMERGMGWVGSGLDGRAVAGVVDGIFQRRFWLGINVRVEC